MEKLGWVLWEKKEYGYPFLKFIIFQVVAVLQGMISMHSYFHVLCQLDTYKTLLSIIIIFILFNFFLASSPPHTVSPSLSLSLSLSLSEVSLWTTFDSNLQSCQNFSLEELANKKCLTQKNNFLFTYLFTDFRGSVNSFLFSFCVIIIIIIINIMCC